MVEDLRSQSTNHKVHRTLSIATVTLSTSLSLNQRRWTAVTSPVTSWATLVVLVLAASVATAAPDDTPRFVVEPVSRVVKPHSQVVLTCRAEPESAGIRWRRPGGEFIDAAKEKDMFIEGGILRITSFKHRPKEYSHVGVYQCVASTPAGTIVSRPAAIERASIGHFEDAADIFVNATEGNVALIPCHPPHGHPPPVTMFEVNNTIIERTTGRHKIFPSGNLQIEKVRQSDQGSYRCIAYNTETGLRRVAPNRVHLRVIAPTVNAPTRIIRGPQGSVEVIRGRNLTLECIVEGSPVPVVTWEKYGGQLPEDRYTQVLGNLVIQRVQMLDQGTYICRANNGEGIGVHTYTGVEVLEPPVIREPPHDKVAIEGATVSFHCTARNNVQIRTDTRWLHNGRNVYRDSFISITETALTINNVQPDHAGMYQCVAHNKLGVTYAAGRLQVQAKGSNISEDFLPHSPNEMQDIAPDSLLPAPSPTILEPPSNTTVAKGASIALPCTPSSPNLKVTWQKDGKPVTPVEAGSDENHKVAAPDTSREAMMVSRYKVGPSGSLQIFNVKPEDMGQFTCIVANTGGIATATAYLTVSDPLTNPPSMEDMSKLPPPRPTSPYPGGTTSPDDPMDRNRGRLDFGEGGLPRQRGDRNKKKGNRRRGKKKDRNKRPLEGSSDTKLVPPSRPEVSKISDTSVRLKWTVPQNDGLSITFFKVQYKAMSGERRKQGWKTVDEDIPSEARMHEVIGLHPGGTYRFRVLAVYSNNDNKQGPNSRRFTLSVEPAHRPQAPSDGPVLVEARPQVRGVQIRWQYLPVDQTPIEGFILHYKTYSSNDFTQVRLPGPKLRLHLVTGLKAGVEYAFKLQCYNTAGTSDYSNQAVKKPLAPDAVVPMVPVHTNHSGVAGDSLGGHHGNGVGPSTTEAASYEWNQVNTQKTNALLYMVLGIVLGIMMLVLVVFMVLCGWKQRQQRRMMAALNANIRKFEDPSKAIYADSIRKKQVNTGGFMLNGITPILTHNGHANGHGPPVITNGHIPNYTLDHNKVNININPMDEMEDGGLGETHPMIETGGTDPEGDSDGEVNECSDGTEQRLCSDSDSHQGQSLAELRASLQGALPPPPLPPQCCGDPTLGSMDRRSQISQRRSADSHTSSDTMNRLDNSINTNHRTRGELDPPDYHSLQLRSPDHVTYRSHDRTSNRSHDRSSDVMAVPYRTSQDYMNDRAAQEPLSTFTRSHDPGRSRDQLSRSESQPGGKQRRRRRRHRDQGVRDMATNTDLSSNEGTLDHRQRRSLARRSLDGLPQGVSGGLGGSPDLSPTTAPPHTQFLPGTQDDLPPYIQPYTDLPRVHDYPASPDEDDDEPEV